MSDAVSRRAWSALTSTEAGDLVERDPVLVLPLAAIEQHGPHLPLSTDLDIGEGILAEALGALPDVFPVRVLPPIAVGASDEHAELPGTLTRSSRNLAAVIEAVGQSLARSGVRRLVLSNSHGGNRAAMESAALRLRGSRGMLVVKASYPRFPKPTSVAFPESEWTHGIHGGAIETSMMLYLRPDLVRRPEIESWGDASTLGEALEGTFEHLMPEGNVSFGWLAKDLHPTGVAGDPRLGTAEAGRTLVQHYGQVLAKVIREARAFPLDRLT